MFCEKGEEMKRKNAIGKAVELIFPRPCQDVSVGKRQTEKDKPPIVCTEKEKKPGEDFRNSSPRYGAKRLKMRNLLLRTRGDPVHIGEKPSGSSC